MGKVLIGTTSSTLVMTFPSTGWFARIKHDEDNIYDAPLICWAVIESGEVQEVAGLIATDEVTVADETEGFMCYIDEYEIKRQAEQRAIERRRV